MRRLLAVGLALVVALLALPAPGRASHKKVEKKSHQKPPPELPVLQLEQIEGGPVAVREALAGQVVIITFWRTGQQHSLDMLKDLVKLRQKLAAKDAKIVGVVSGPTERAEVVKIAHEFGVRFPVWFDPERRLYAAFHVIVSPTTWFVDAKGVGRIEYPGHRRDFPRLARANVDFLHGRISKKDLEAHKRPRNGAPVGKAAGPQTRFRLARRLLSQGQLDAARAQFERAWRAEPPVPEAGIALALMALEEEHYPQALELAEAARRLVPENARAQGAKGVALIHLKREGEGARLLRAAVAREPREPLLYYELGQLDERRDAYDEACESYRLGLELTLSRQRRAGRDAVRHESQPSEKKARATDK